MKILCCLCIIAAIGYFVYFIASVICNYPIYPFAWFAPIIEYIEFRHSDERVCKIWQTGDSKWKYEYAIAKNIPIMKFDTFLSIYALNPKKYDIDGSITVKYDLITDSAYCDMYRAIFTFSYRDWRRFVAWKRRMAKNKEQKQRNKDIQCMNEALAAMLQDIQKDIDKTREKSKRETEKGLAENLSAIGRLYGVPADQLNEFMKFHVWTPADARPSGDASSSEAPHTSRPQVPVGHGFNKAGTPVLY